MHSRGEIPPSKRATNTILTGSPMILSPLIFRGFVHISDGGGLRLPEIGTQAVRGHSGDRPWANFWQTCSVTAEAASDLRVLPRSPGTASWSVPGPYVWLEGFPLSEPHVIGTEIARLIWLRGGYFMEGSRMVCMHSRGEIPPSKCAGSPS